MKRLLILLCFGIISTIAGSPPAYTPTKEKLQFLSKKHLFEEDIYKRSLTSELFIEALYYAEVISPEIAYKQALIETGRFTSNLFWRGNNAFGMKMARRRETTATSTVYGHAAYSHWYDSVKDYVLWQQWYKDRGYSMDNYLDFLQEVGYATDRHYISKLKNICDYS